MNRLIRACQVRLTTAVALMRARRASLRRLGTSTPSRLLVICYGNIYRSAFVGEYLRARLTGMAEVRSAGFHAVAGRQSPARHVEMCRPYGVALDQHRSAVASATDMEWADLIIVMDRHNWAAVRALGADPEKIIWLAALIPGAVEISDPYPLDDEAARTVVARLHEAADRLADNLTARRDGPESPATTTAGS